MQKRARTEKPRVRMDIRDVARRAGVSISTVSRVTNGKGTVNREMADRVWRAVRELNYQPDPQARALVSGRSHIIGLMVTEITNPFFPELIQCFEQFAVESGYEVLLASTPNDAASIAMSVRRMLQRKVDGVAVMMFGREAPILEELATHAVPLVVMDGAPAFPKIDAVRVNYDEGICHAVAHLFELGHQAIAFVSGPLEQASARLRRDAFEKAMRSCRLKLRPDLLIEGDHTLEGGMTAMTQLLARANPPTAVVCSNDLTAIGVLHCLFEAGKEVPADLSVIGFDDVHIAQFMLPPLTTVRMSCADIARVAFATLRHRIEPGSTRYAVRPVETKLILRQTTGRPSREPPDGIRKPARIKPPQNL
jgi:DNA-binding LacI/PurR family transcriptional regulator